METTTFAKQEADFEIENHGSIFLFRPLNDNASEHIRERTGEEAQWFGGALVVEHRYAKEMAENLYEAGFKLS